MDNPEGEIQFRCKLCQFTGSDKSEIAEHFLSEHIEVEYVSPRKKEGKEKEKKEKEKKNKGKKDKAKKDKSADENVKEEKDDSFPEKSPSRKRGRPRGKKSISVKSPKIKVLPEPADDTPDSPDYPEHLGRGMRNRKKKVTLHVDEMSSEEGDEDIFGSEEDDNDSEFDFGDELEDELKDTVEEEEEEEELTQEQTLDELKKNPIRIKPLDFKPRRRGRPRKSEKRSHQKRDQNWSAMDDVKPKREVHVRVNLVVPMKVFTLIVRDRVDEWQKTFDEKNSLDHFRCEVERCHGAGMPEAEFDVHMKCHVSNMEGFRCFICQFMCLHWRNMRHHYRKVHDQMLTKVTCDFAGCQKEFQRTGALRNHVTIIHIKPPVVEKLSSNKSDLSEFSSYLENVKIKKIEEKNNANENDDDGEDDEEEPKKRRGRPPKRKRPVGRPSNETDPPKKKQSYQRRLHGEDREKFQRRLVAFVCDVCTAKFNDEGTMMKHNIKHYRDGSDQIHCTECESFIAGEESSLRIHMADEHKRLLQLHRCDRCNFSSNRYHDLKKHNIVHTGAKNFMCDKCGKCTTTPYNLKVHYSRMHASDEEKNIKCISCEYRCADKAVLKDHIRQKHGLLINGDEYTNPRSMLLFPCPHCPYMGRKQSSLDYHMRIHNENRQYKCHICPYASKTKNNLVLHLRTHDGMRPVKCPHCDFRGATNKIISEHVMCKHANVRPYHCNICGWSTAYSGNMWKHVDTHQKELKDKMPEFPVNVVSTDEHSVPTPLRAPTGKRRGMNKAANFKLKLAKPGKARRQQQAQKLRPMEQTTTISILEERNNVQTIQVQAGGDLPEGVLMQVPVHTILGANGQMMVTKGLSQEEAIGSTALSRLAAAVASSQEVHIIRNNDGLEGGVQQQEHRVITTQLDDNNIPTSIHVEANNGMNQQEIIEYTTVPSVSQQIITSGDITEVITSDHHYHAIQHFGDHQQLQQHHHHHQQQQQQQHQQQHGGDSSIQQAAMHAGIPTTSGGEQVPTAIVEQIVQDTPHGDDQNVVHNLVASMIPHEAELVMSMMQIQQVPQVQQVQHIQQVQQVHHVQQPNVSQ